MTNEEGLKRPIGTVKLKEKPSTRKEPGTTTSTFAPSGYTAASFAPVTQFVWAEVGESPVVVALTEKHNPPSPTTSPSQTPSGSSSPPLSPTSKASASSPRT